MELLYWEFFQYFPNWGSSSYFIVTFNSFKDGLIVLTRFKSFKEGPIVLITLLKIRLAGLN